MCQTTERAELLLRNDTASPSAARAFALASGCTEHATDVLDEALLLISELVTNSVKYGGPPILLAIECDGQGLRVRVRDGAAALPQQRTASVSDESGRGLALVDLISNAWGVEPVEDEYGVGKAVWFELRPTT
jgi:anti-sigma regulatory factor (Ser/Thr protein kinase)